MIPQQKIEANGNEIQNDCLSSTVWRIENGVSRAAIIANDRYGRHFIDDLDVLDILKVSYKYASQTAWTKVFEGTILEPTPTIEKSQKVTGSLAYGYGRALLKTHCGVNYGVESENSAINTPSQIIEDIRANRVELNFDAGATGHTINAGKVLAMANPEIQFIKGGYRPNIDILNQICLLYQAWRAGSSGIHWFVDPAKYLYVDQIGNHTVAGWSTWWRTNQAGSTLTEGIDFLEATFPKNGKGYANKVLLFTDLRKPGYDYWTEDSGGSKLWGNTGFTSITDDNTATYFLVGSHSVKLLQNGGAPGMAWILASSLSGNAAAAQPDVAVTDASAFKVGDSVHLWDNNPLSEDKIIGSIAGNTLTMTVNLTNAYATASNAHCTKNSGWNLSKVGSQENAPHLNFYSLINTNISTATTYIRLFTTAFDTDYFWSQFCVGNSTTAGEFTHHSMPIGKYWKTKEKSGTSWTKVGNADWENINGIAFYTYNAGPVGNGTIWIDDLHISGKLIRESYNSTEIAATPEIQKTVRLDVAVDDSMKETDDTGTAARLAYAELLNVQTVPTTGTIHIKGAQDILPGQQVYIQAHKHYSTYAIGDTFRVTQAIHSFKNNQFSTQLDLTDDLVNSFSAGPAEQLSALAKVLYVDPEAKSLKSSGIDALVERLSVDYP